MRIINIAAFAVLTIAAIGVLEAIGLADKPSSDEPAPAIDSPSATSTPDVLDCLSAWSAAYAKAAADLARADADAAKTIPDLLAIDGNDVDAATAAIATATAARVAYDAAAAAAWDTIPRLEECAP